MIVNGVTLPDIPADVLAQYRYLTIVGTIGTNSQGTMAAYILQASNSEFAVVPPGMQMFDGESYTYNTLVWTKKSGATFLYMAGMYDSWTEDANYIGSTSPVDWTMDLTEINGTVQEFDLLATNHDICIATAYDIATQTPTVGTEVYCTATAGFPPGAEPKPTRVSIGRSLVDGYAREVQRLTGTADQMNAIQIREKLSTVKSAIKIGDTVLPPIPEDVESKYPYVVILSVDNPNGSAVYAVIGTKLKTVFVPVEIGGSAADSDGGLFTEQLCLAGAYMLTGKEWVIMGETDNDAPIFHIGGATGTSIVWSNYDIYTATAYDDVNKVPTAGTEVYFSERQNFNGVWLPKVPADVLAEYPYAVIIDDRDKESGYPLGLYMLVLAKDVLAHVPTELTTVGYSKLVSKSSGMKQYIVMPSEGITNWMLVGESTDSFPDMCIEEGDYDGNEQFYVIWSNHDILTATTYDGETGDYTIGTGLYFPPLPTIDSDRVSIGYDLCDGIVEEVQRLSGESEKMNALHAYWKLTQVPVAVDGSNGDGGGSDDDTEGSDEIVVDGIKLPAFPVEDYSYILVALHTNINKYYLQFSNAKYYFNRSKNIVDCSAAQPYFEGKVYTYAPSADSGWVHYTYSSVMGFDMKYNVIKWSNYDIHEGSVDSGTIYFPSSV